MSNIAIEQRSATSSVVGEVTAWGIAATLGWTAAALAMSAVAAIVVARAIAPWDGGQADYQFLFRQGDAKGSTVVMTMFLCLVAALAAAARLSGSSIRSYLALVPPQGRYLLLGLAGVVLPVLGSYVFLLHFDFAAQHPHGFDRALATNGLLVHFLAVVVAAPVMEEIVFRGFLYRGLSELRIGVAGTILLTSVVWAFIHLDHNMAGLISTTAHGIVWGWLRRYTGSILVPLACHVGNNAFFSLLILANLYGWFG